MLLYAAGGGGAVILPRNAHLSALHLCAVAWLEAVFARPAFTAFWMMASKSGQLFFPMLTASFSYGVAPLKEAACCYSSSGKG